MSLAEQIAAAKAAAWGIAAAAHREQIAGERSAALTRAQAARDAIAEAERLADRAERLRAKARGLRIESLSPRPRASACPDFAALAAEADREAAAVERAAAEWALGVCSMRIEPL